MINPTRTLSNGMEIPCIGMGTFGSDRFSPDQVSKAVEGAIDQAINIGRKGSDIIVAGVYGDNTTVNMGLVQDKELNLTGTLMYTKENWLDAIRFVSEKKILLEPLMSAYFPLAELAEAFQYIEDNKDIAIKVLIKS